ncbi:DUF4232 domain-containing protein [Lapillicoccus jejuensis]|uniref:Uncharacterized protein DUF4232 n=1 Tax=Lapillicoccus jejuensis TaxID=402171 RepID=A0A542DYV2_9MICO|nr:DUF4232 domain-containing protein [Lapillicoccus jejuensis]TQJ08275.1 uncharacterized protein DUF4232 [Lapillicoccus jejuensis]
MGTAHRPTTRRTTTRATLALGSALLAAGALGACSTSDGTTQTGAQAPVTTTVTSTEPPASTTTSADAGSGSGTTTTASGGAEAPGTTTTTGGSATTTTCQPSQMTLRVEMPAGGGSAGHVAVQLIATNKGSTVCTTQGFPGVSLVAGGTGQQLGAAADRATGQSAPLMRLEPGKTAVATIQVAQAANFPSCSETTASGFRVYLPGTTAAAYVPYSLQACANPSVHQLQVQPFNA